MKSFLSLMLAVVFVAPLAAVQADQDGWHPLKSHEGNLKAMLPADPVYQVQEIDAEWGKINLHMFIAEIENGAEAYIVFYNDFPRDHIDSHGTDGILKLAREGALNSQNGQLKQDPQDIDVAGNPGTEFHFTAESPTGSTVHCSWRIFVAGTRMYQLGVACDGEEIDDAMREKFMDSFAFLR